uniref:Uncharacterized protein n=1 Tax=Pararge aegeria TaxID=116150 RepID=S4PLL1_9NEOP
MSDIRYKSVTKAEKRNDKQRFQEIKSQYFSIGFVIVNIIYSTFIDKQYNLKSKLAISKYSIAHLLFIFFLTQFCVACTQIAPSSLQLRL